MWADTLLELERAHILRLLIWSAGSVLLGTLLLLHVVWRRLDASLLRHFALQMMLWGLVLILFCAWSWNELALRDYAGAQHLVNLLWLNIGLNAGYVGCGATLAITAWKLGKRAGAVGAGVGIMVQGMALFLLDARLVATIGPLR